jgi:hypothetical protein
MMNKKNIAKIIQLIIIWSLIIQFVPVIQAEPTIEITPTKPEAESDVTFEVDLTGENVQNAYLWIQECNINTGICYTDQNVSMTETSDGIYETTFTLEHDDATYFQYSILVNTGSGWLTFFKQTKVNLAEPSNNNGNTGNGDSGSDTPGFEFVALFMSVIFILLIMYRRKR